MTLIDIKHPQKETENIDQDLVEYAISPLDKTNFDNTETTNSNALVAYYINSFIVKTAGSAAFERIQSHSFSKGGRSENYKADECPVSLNYFDCKDSDRCELYTFIAFIWLALYFNHNVWQ